MENKILIIGPAWVGDMVMAQTLFKVIKQKRPEAIIDVLAPIWTEPLLSRMPEIRRSIVMPIGHGVFALKERYKLSRTIEVEGYKEAIVLPNSWKSALIPFLAKIPKRTGWCGELRFGLLNDLRILDKKALPRMIDRFVALAYEKNVMPSNPIAVPRLEVQEDLLKATMVKFGVSKEDERPILVLCPGAEFGPSKRWPSHHYGTLAVQMIQEGWWVWLMGSKNDLPVVDEIQEKTGGKCLNLAGKTNLGEAIDLMSLAKRVVTNDSGLMHIAAALNIPLVAVYGSTDPGFTPPLSKTCKIVRLSLPCSPCFQRECPLGHHHCMENLSPKQVAQAVYFSEDETSDVVSSKM